ncbi:MAG: hypothetical protein ACOVOV_12125, partial [Dolichospermum sp.]
MSVNVKKCILTFFLYLVCSLTAISQVTINQGTNFNLCGRATSGIYSTRPTDADFITGTNEFVTDIVSVTNTGAAIDFDSDGFNEVVLRTMGLSGTNGNQTRFYIFEATANNSYSRVAMQLIDSGSSASSPGLSKGLDVGNIDGDAAPEIVLSSGVATSTFLNAYDISSGFAVTRMAGRRMYGFAGSIISTSSGTINTVKIVPNKNGNSNPDIIISQATGSITHLAAIEFDNVTGFTWLTNGAMSNYNGGVYAFNVADMDSDGNLEIIMVCETTSGSLRIREYITDATEANRFGTADLTVTGNWNAATSGQAYTSISIADIDGDGDLEAAVPDFQNRTIKVVTYNSGTTSYDATTVISLSAAAQTPIATAIADLDRDGKKEILYTTLHATNPGSVTLREHDGTANTFATTNFVNFASLISGVGTSGTHRISAIAVNELSNSADNDNNFEVFLGRSSNNTDLDLDGDEFFVLEINRFFGGGTGISGYGATPTIAPSGTYDNITTDGTSSLGGAVNLNGILRVRNGTFSTGSNNLTFASTASAVIDSTGILSINGGITDFANSPVTIVSGQTGTGIVGNITGTLNNATNVTVERFLPSRRAWRFLTAPITQGSPSSLNATWKDSVDIVGPSGANLSATTNGYNFLTYNSSTDSWNNITDPTLETLTGTSLNKAFAAFIPGRAGTLAITDSTNVTLRSTGTLLTGTKTFNSSAATNSYVFVPNPYASPIDLESVFASSTGIYSTIYTWDPRLGGPIGTGGYVAIQRTAPNTFTFTPDWGVTTQDRNIQIGQAFFVHASATSQSVVFNESGKSTTNVNTVFGAGTGNTDLLRIAIHKNQNGQMYHIGEVLSTYGSNFSSAVNFSEDAEKLWNNEENIALRRGTYNLSIESRPFIGATNDSIFIG